MGEGGVHGALDALALGVPAADAGRVAGGAVAGELGQDAGAAGAGAGFAFQDEGDAGLGQGVAGVVEQRQSAVGGQHARGEVLDRRAQHRLGAVLQQQVVGDGQGGGARRRGRW